MLHWYHIQRNKYSLLCCEELRVIHKDISFYFEKYINFNCIVLLFYYKFYINGFILINIYIVVYIFKKHWYHWYDKL